MTFIYAAFAIFIFALLLAALDYWDRSQGGNGFLGILKVVGCLLRWLALGLFALFLLCSTALLSASGFWAGLFRLLFLQSSGIVCLGLSCLVLFFVLVMYVDRQQRR